MPRRTASTSPRSKRRPLYTIGHSNRSFDELVDALRAFDVDMVVDIRLIGRSRANPQFNGPALARRLPRAEVDFVAIPELAGRRKRSPDANPARNAGWENQSFHNYADYAETAAFRAGLDQLLALTRTHTCAIMCAEAVWWRCHRRIVADYALTEGLRVLHIFTAQKVEPAKRTPFAKLDRRTRTLRYARS